MSAAITAAVVGAGAAVYGASEAGKAGKEAAKGAQAAAGVSERQFDITNNLTANQRAIGNQALNALGAKYGFTPAAGFGADYDPYNLNPDQTAKGLGSRQLSGADLRNLLSEGLSIDQILEIGAVRSDADLSKIGRFGLAPSEVERLRAGTFSPEYRASKNPGATGVGAPRQFSPGFQNPGVSGQFMGGSQTNPGMVPAEDFIDTSRLRELAGPNKRLQELAGPVDTSLAAFEASPDYQFRLKEGLDAVQSSAAARGGLYSGNALRGITDYASGLASGEYNDFFNRRQADRAGEFGRLQANVGDEYNRELNQLQLRRNFSDSDFNRLANLAGIGSTATQNLTSVGVNTAGNIGNALIGAGNARASGIEGGANALLGGAANLTSLAGFLNRGNQRSSGVSASDAFNDSIRRSNALNAFDSSRF